MTVQQSVPGREGRVVVTVYNGSTAAVVKANTIVRLDTSTTVNNIPKVHNIGATAGTVIRLFGACEEEIATGGYGPCVIHGPALVTAHGAITVKTAVTATPGTSGIRGRTTSCTIGTAGAAVSSKYLGWALTVGSTGATHVVFVNTVHSTNQ